MDMRMMLNGNEPMRFDPTSAESAVNVHAIATQSDMVSPINTDYYLFFEYIL